MTASPFSVKRLGSSWIRWLILTLLLGTATVVLIARTDKQEVEIAIAATFENLAGDLLLTEGTPANNQNVDFRHLIRFKID
jgi:hypothetical protein